jgi:hypothetical protein
MCLFCCMQNHSYVFMIPTFFTSTFTGADAETIEVLQAVIPSISNNMLIIINCLFMINPKPAIIIHEPELF